MIRVWACHRLCSKTAMQTYKDEMPLTCLILLPTNCILHLSISIIN